MYTVQDLEGPNSYYQSSLVVVVAVVVVELLLLAGVYMCVGFTCG